MKYSKVMQFIIDNFKFHYDEKRNHSCPNYGELRCKTVKNTWGNLTLPTGETICPETVTIVRLFSWNMDWYCRDDIPANRVAMFYTVLHEGILYYMGVEKYMDIEGDPWGYGSNQDNWTWNEYYAPMMDTCTHKLYKMNYIVDKACLGPYSESEGVSMTDKDAEKYLPK